MQEGDAPLRILYSFPHPLGSPGIGTTAWHQVDELTRAGHRVHVVTTRLAEALPPGSSALTTLPALPGRALGKLMGTDRAMAWTDAATAAAIRYAPSAYDVVHTWPAGGLRTIRAASARGVAAVRELPNTHTENAYRSATEEAEVIGVPLASRSSHAFHGPRLAREMMEYAEATALLAPSDVVAKSFLDRGFDPRRVLRHRYGFDPRQFRLETALALRQGTSKALRALFVGRAEPRKGLHLALRAWRASRASVHGTFTVCGAFAPGYREALADLLDHPSVRIVGFVPDPSHLYAEHDVFLLPSLEEGSALVTYEASAMGCVPFVSDATGAQCTDGVDGLVHPVRDWQVLRMHLDRVLDDAALLARMRSACIDGRDRLAWAEGVALTVEAYRRALTMRYSPRRKETAR